MFTAFSSPSSHGCIGQATAVVRIYVSSPKSALEQLKSITNIPKAALSQFIWCHRFSPAVANALTAVVKRGLKMFTASLSRPTVPVDGDASPI